MKHKMKPLVKTKDKKKILVIVESPSKIKKIESILSSLYPDQEFIAKASYGHIRDLDPKKLSINIDKNFQPIYVQGQNKERVISELKYANKQCQEVWIASDLDREGESIAWHVSQMLKLDPSRRKRIVFSEITKSALKTAVENPKDIDISMFDAQQARRVIDRLIGYLISPILWKQIQNSTKKKVSLSAGRVQSVVMKMIIEREQEIKKFESSGYYKTSGSFKTKDDEIVNSDLSCQFENKNLTKDFLNKCQQSTFKIESIDKKKSTRKPSAPFITSTLQQEASTKLRMSPKSTMASAQKLYEGGYITYMRTDSFDLSQESLDMITNYINQNYGEQYLKIQAYKSKSKNSQEAHEAIRPCNFKLTSLKDDETMTNFEERLYRLIWNRTVASQMAHCKVDLFTTKISISEFPEENFVTKNEKITFDGFTRVYRQINEEEEDEADNTNKNKQSLIKKLKVGDTLNIDSIISSEKFSKPPHGRFTEASLVKKLDEMGIGRPSTYSSMVSVVQDRNYVAKRDQEGQEKNANIYTLKNDEIVKNKNTIKIGGEKQKLFPSQIGFIVNEFLDSHFSSIIDYKFTAKLENYLDDISSGKIVWTDIVGKIYNMFKPKLEEFGSTQILEKDKFKRVLGEDPKTGFHVQTYIAKYGPVVQIVDPNGDHKYAPLKDIDIKEVTLEQALELLKYPYILLNYKNKPVNICKGKYGVYIKYNDKNYSTGEISEENLNEDTIKNIIDASQNDQETKSNIIKTINDKIIIKNGKYGPYVSYKNKLNIKIYGNKKPEDLTLDDCVVMINRKKQKKNNK